MLIINYLDNYMILFLFIYKSIKMSIYIQYMYIYLSLGLPDDHQVGQDGGGGHGGEGLGRWHHQGMLCHCGARE